MPRPVLLGPADHSDYTNQTWHAAFRHRSALASGAWCRNGYQADAQDRGLPFEAPSSGPASVLREEAVATTGIAVTCAPEGGTSPGNRRCSHRCGSDGSGDGEFATPIRSRWSPSRWTRTRMSAVSQRLVLAGVDLGLGRRGRHRGHSVAVAGHHYAGDDLLDVLAPDVPTSLETVQTTLRDDDHPTSHADRMWSNRMTRTHPNHVSSQRGPIAPQQPHRTVELKVVEQCVHDRADGR